MERAILDGLAKVLPNDPPHVAAGKRARYLRAQQEAAAQRPVGQALPGAQAPRVQPALPNRPAPTAGHDGQRMAWNEVMHEEPGAENFQHGAAFLARRQKTRELEDLAEAELKRNGPLPRDCYIILDLDNDKPRYYSASTKQYLAEDMHPSSQWFAGEEVVEPDEADVVFRKEIAPFSHPLPYVHGRFSWASFNDSAEAFVESARHVRRALNKTPITIGDAKERRLQAALELTSLSAADSHMYHAAEGDYVGSDQEHMLAILARMFGLTLVVVQCDVKIKDFFAKSPKDVPAGSQGPNTYARHSFRVGYGTETFHEVPVGYFLESWWGLIPRYEHSLYEKNLSPRQYDWEAKFAAFKEQGYPFPLEVFIQVVVALYFAYRCGIVQGNQRSQLDWSIGSLSAHLEQHRSGLGKWLVDYDGRVTCKGFETSPATRLDFAWVQMAVRYNMGARKALQNWELTYAQLAVADASTDWLVDSVQSRQLLFNLKPRSPFSEDCRTHNP